MTGLWAVDVRLTLLGLGGTVLCALLAGLLGGGAVVSKWLDRRVTKAAADHADIDNLRAIIATVREDAAAERAVRVGLEERVDILEERERHMLTRAGAHEAWDQFAFALLIASNPQHPPPPPLTPPPTERPTP